MTPLQTCTKCYILKPLDCFSVRKDTGGHRTWCRECHRAKVKEYRAGKVEGTPVPVSGGREKLDGFLKEYLTRGTEG